MKNPHGETNFQKVPVKLPRFQLYGHYAHELQKVAIELPQFAVLATDRRTATGITMTMLYMIFLLQVIGYRPPL